MSMNIPYTFIFVLLFQYGVFYILWWRVLRCRHRYLRLGRGTILFTTTIALSVWRNHRNAIVSTKTFRCCRRDEFCVFLFLHFFFFARCRRRLTQFNKTANAGNQLQKSDFWSPGRGRRHSSRVRYFNVFNDLRNRVPVLVFLFIISDAPVFLVVYVVWNFSNLFLLL